MSSSVVRRCLTAIALCAATAGAACSAPETPGAPDDQPNPDTVSSSVVSSTAESNDTSSSTKASTSTSAAASTTDKEDAAAVKTVAEQFASLAPKEFFDKFDTCTPVESEGSYDCSGAQVGQFQFFDSEAKAASTTQLLTELRSARIVEDTGERVVGWTTLGTSAIITVVDNEKGQVLQQLVSSDQEDPQERIFELGLADRNAEPSAPAQESPAEAEPAA